MPYNIILIIIIIIIMTLTPTAEYFHHFRQGRLPPLLILASEANLRRTQHQQTGQETLPGRQPLQLHSLRPLQWVGSLSRLMLKVDACAELRLRENRQRIRIRLKVQACSSSKPQGVLEFN